MKKGILFIIIGSMVLLSGYTTEKTTARGTRENDNHEDFCYFVYRPQEAPACFKKSE